MAFLRQSRIMTASWHMTGGMPKIQRRQYRNEKKGGSSG